jgi:adenine-specific DNA-methyltransferase
MTSTTWDSDTETARLARQVALDAERSARERNELGQFATPPALADDVMRYVLGLHADPKIRFLEPSCGSGSFFSSLLRSVGDDQRVAEATGVELDPRFAAVAADLWGPRGLKVVEGDFTVPDNTPSAQFSLLVANPPYVRHHHLGAAAKSALVARSKAELGITPSGLSGLYVHFMLLAHRNLAPGAISAWLIPSEFMDVNYGRALKQYLTSKVRLLRIHRFDASDVQFDDALVTSAVVVFENIPPRTADLADFTYGGSVSRPRERFATTIRDLNPTAKWSGRFASQEVRSEDHPLFVEFFKIRRGIATGGNKFFVMPLDAAEKRGFGLEHLRPILPSPRHLKGLEVDSDERGYPDIPLKLAMIDTSKPIELLREDDPALAMYLDEAPESLTGAYLTSRRTPWYRQEERAPAPFLLTYMGRGVDTERPFRFILNRSQAVATNMYLMLYPTPRLQRYLDAEPDGLTRVHEALLGVSGDALRSGGRVYGGGLHKMEPRELAAMDATFIVDLDPERLAGPRQGALL